MSRNPIGALSPAGGAHQGNVPAAEGRVGSLRPVDAIHANPVVTWGRLNGDDESVVVPVAEGATYVGASDVRQRGGFHAVYVNANCDRLCCIGIEGPPRDSEVRRGRG